MFPFSTRRQNSDSSCIVLPGEGAPEFIEHESFILYREAMELSEYAIQDATQRRYCSPIGSVTPELLARILRGGLNSKFLKNRLKKIISDHLDQR